jgi:hypothetical protein
MYSLMYRQASAVVVCAFLLFLHSATAPGASHGEEPAIAQALEAISTERMVSDVALLSSEQLNGRQAGTPDDEFAAEYVARQLRESGPKVPLVPLAMDDSAAVTVTTISPTPSLSVEFPGRLKSERTMFRVGIDYLPILDSPSVQIHAPIVFVGYGIADTARGFDEYAGIDVKGRVVLFLRGKPERYAGQITHAEKVRIAHEKGAGAYLTATGPILHAYEARRGIGGKPSAYYSQSPIELPGAWISTELAERIVARAGDSLRDRQERLHQLSFQSHQTAAVMEMQWTSARTPGIVRNIGFLLAGSEDAWRDETVILGAHRDHFGRQAGLLFAGADDNASGTAVVLETARVIAQSGLRPKRSILFLSFSGEEQGLLGSKAYVRHPIRPLDRTKVMINVDHAGIGNGRLTVGLTGLDKAVAAAAGRLAGMEDRLDLFGYFPGGDHVPFKEAGVPTITIVSGGTHSHFHQPTDRADTITPEILAAAARYAVSLTLQLANAP